MFRFGQVIPGIDWQGADSTTNPAEVAVTLMLQLAAALSLIYVVIAAVRLTTSSGDPQAVAAGRKTLIFAIVGLIVSVLGMTLTAIIQSRAAEVASSGNPFFGEGGIVTVVFEMLTFAVGVASVIMLIVGGLRYITSAGQPQSAQAARNTIIYAIVGVVVAVISQLLISFVLTRIGGN